MKQDNNTMHHINEPFNGSCCKAWSLVIKRMHGLYVERTALRREVRQLRAMVTREVTLH